VRYGTFPPPGTDAATPGLTTSHVVELANLEPCADYVFSVASADAAGNETVDDNGGTYHAFTAGEDSSASFASAIPPVSIPDNDAAGASMSLTVPVHKTLVDVNVQVNITHTATGNLVLSLVPPAGPAILLASHRGGNGDNFVGTEFDDEASVAIASGVGPFTGSFRPESSLIALNGLLAAGTWMSRAVVVSGFWWARSTTSR
jgi:hypothetical protein